MKIFKLILSLLLIEIMMFFITSCSSEPSKQPPDISKQTAESSVESRGKIKEENISNVPSEETLKSEISNRLISNYAKGEKALEEYIGEIDKWTVLTQQCEKNTGRKILGDQNMVRECPDLLMPYRELLKKQLGLYDQLIAHFHGSPRFLDIQIRGETIMIKRNSGPGELGNGAYDLDEYYYDERHRCVDINSEEGKRLMAEDKRDRMHYTYVGDPPGVVCKWKRPPRRF